MSSHAVFREKLREAVKSVLPIAMIVAFLAFTIAPVPTDLMLPFAFGVCQATGGNLLTDAFGIVALVALMPLITVQVMGVLSLPVTEITGLRRRT